MDQGPLAVGSPDACLFTHKPASGSRSRGASPCSTLDDFINVSVKNTFLDFSDSPRDSPPSEGGRVRRTRSLDGLSSDRRNSPTRDDEVWTCSPRPVPLNRVGSWPTELCLDPLLPNNAKATSSRDTCKVDAPLEGTKEGRRDVGQESNDQYDIYIQQECVSENDFIAEVASYHGAAKRLGREQGQYIAHRFSQQVPRRVSSWPGPNMADDAIEGEDVEFDLTIEEDEKPIKPVYTSVRHQVEHSRFGECRQEQAHSPINQPYVNVNQGRQNYGYDRYPRYHPNAQLVRVSSVPNMDAEGNYYECIPDMRRSALGGQSPKITQFGGVEYAHNRVPKKKNLQREFERASVPMTTIMIRNIPNRYRQDELVHEINLNGLEGTYDFVYLPMDKSTKSNVGYSFVNFTEEHFAVKAMQIFTSYRFSKYQRISRKIASASVAHIQGFEANLKHYQQSAVNDGKVTDNRPLVIPQIYHRVSESGELRYP